MRLHNRQVKAAFWDDPKLLRLRRDTRTLFHGLWHLADDSGCLEYDTFAFKTFLFRSPIDDDMSIERLGDLTQELIGVELLIPYTADRKPCLFIRNFHKHQSLRSPAPPDVPLPLWIVWRASEKKQRSGEYIVRSPNRGATDAAGQANEPPTATEPTANDERTASVGKPYGDLTEPKGNQARARNEPEPEPEREPEPEPLVATEEDEGAPAARSSSTSGEQDTWIKWHERTFAVPPSGRALQDYAQLAERGVADDLIIEGIERARRAKKTAPVQYAVTVIGGWFADGIKTLAQLRQAEAAAETEQSAARRPQSGDDQGRPPDDDYDDPITLRAREQARQLRMAAGVEHEDPRDRIRQKMAVQGSQVKSTDQIE